MRFLSPLLSLTVAAAVVSPGADSAPSPAPVAPVPVPVPVPAPGWRDMLREYDRLREARADCSAKFPGFDPEMARLGEAFALTAYPKNDELGRKNFRRLALRLNLSTPPDGMRAKIFTPNKEPWPGYKGPVDSGGLAHFVFNTGTLPLPLLDHPVVRIVLRSSVSRSRIQPAAQCAARVIRAGDYDLSLVEHDAATRAELVSKIRKSFDAEHAGEPMNDDEAECLAKCLPYMT